MPFTPEELAAMAAADAEIESSFILTPEELALGRELDREITLEMMDPRKRRIAQNERAYREAHREEIAQNKRAYYEAHKEKLKAYQREYHKRKRARQSGNSEQAQTK